jgi:transcriptional regulator with XRE-family HTH domain
MSDNRDKLVKVFAQIKVRGLTIETLSKTSGIKYDTLASYLSGRRKLSLQAAIQLAQTLECSLDYLFMPEVTSSPDPGDTIARDKAYLAGKLNVTPDCITIELLEELLASTNKPGIIKVATKLKSMLQ